MGTNWSRQGWGGGWRAGEVPSPSLLVLATLALLAMTPLGAGAQEPLVFRSVSELVVVPALVFASDGGPVLDLTVADFRITEDGKERPISVFSRPDSGPIEIALVVDASNSMNLVPGTEATTKLLRGLHPDSCVLVLPFSDQVHTGTWGHPHDWWMKPTVVAINRNGNTALYDALMAAFHLLRTRAATVEEAEGRSVGGIGPINFGELMGFRAPGAPGSTVPAPSGGCTIQQDRAVSGAPATKLRRAIVVVSDGEDNASVAAIEDVLLSAWGSNIPVFAFAQTRRVRRVPFSRFVRRRPREKPGHVRALERLAEHSGGLLVRGTGSDEDQQFLDGFSRLGAALRSHYVLGYVPAKRIDADAVVDRRSIEVTVRRPGFDVLAPQDLELGRGASEGAALDLALRGFHELAAGRAEEALATFGTAAALGPRLGLVPFGRGIALSILEQPANALAALRTADELAPWLPDLDARIADLLIETGDLDAAWERALRAREAGSRVDEIVARLQHLAPRHLDPTPVAAPPRIALWLQSKAGVQGLFAAPTLAAALTHAMQRSAQLAYVGDTDTAQFVLRVVLTRAARRGGGTQVSGTLALENPTGEKVTNPSGQTLLLRNFKVSNARSEAVVRSVVDPLVAELERLLASTEQR